MIEFARKPGLNAYWVTQYRYTKLAGNIVLENLDVTGYGRFQRADLVGHWELPFIKVFEDGDHICALVGDNLQEGIAEFMPLVAGKDKFDQITDCGTAYVMAHRDTKIPDRFNYWERHEIDMMAEQSRSRRKASK